MLIIDAHLDLSWNALQWNRDLTQSVYTLRTQEATTAGRGQNTVALPEMRQGRIALCFATLLARSTAIPRPHVDFRSPEQAYGITQGQLAYYRALQKRGVIRLIQDVESLNEHMAAWETWESNGATMESTPPTGMVISMESADSILTPEQIPDWYADGLRLIGPAHYGMGRYVGGTSVEDGFTESGFRLLEQMEANHFILDMTHLTDRAFDEALDHFGGRIIASHNMCRALVPHQRQFSDAQLRAIIARDGVIGAALDTWMLQAGWIKGVSSNESVTLEAVVDHIDHVCQLAGNASHAGIGSDLDGGFGREQSPCDLDTIADLQQIAVILDKRGYSEPDIQAVMYKNWLNFLRSAWNA